MLGTMASYAMGFDCPLLPSNVPVDAGSASMTDCLHLGASLRTKLESRKKESSLLLATIDDIDGESMIN